MGKQLVLVCKRLTQGKIATGNVHGSAKKNKRICRDSSQGKVYGIVRTQRVSANHEKLKNVTNITRRLVSCCVHLGDKSYAELVRQNNRIIEHFWECFYISGKEFVDGYLHNCQLTDLLEKSHATVQKESVDRY